MKFTTLIPTHYNDGRRVPRTLMRSFVDDLTQRFGGCSNEGLTSGQWIDPQDGGLYRDERRRISVVCDRVQLDQARRALIRIGLALKQRAMYFEVRDYDGVQFLEIPYAQK